MKETAKYQFVNKGNTKGAITNKERARMAKDEKDRNRMLGKSKGLKGHNFFKMQRTRRNPYDTCKSWWDPSVPASERYRLL